MTRAALLLALLLLLSSRAPAQIDTAASRGRAISAIVGIGAAAHGRSLDDGDIIAGGLIFSGAINDWSMLTLRMLLAGEFRICIWGCSDQPLQQFEVGLLYGVMERGTAGLVAVSLGGGLALGYYDPRDSYAPGFDYVVPALVADLQAFVALGRTFGIGAYGYANLTSHTITLGGLFGLRAGRFE